MAELLAHASRVQGWVEHHGGGVGQQSRIDVNRRRYEEPNLVRAGGWRQVFGISVSIRHGNPNGIGARSGIGMNNCVAVNRRCTAVNVNAATSPNIGRCAITKAE